VSDRLASDKRFIQYSGMSYEDASREAARLIARDGWFKNWERLVALREIMLLALREKPRDVA